MTAIENQNCECSMKTIEPDVSWLLCTHKANDQLKLAINSCLNQTYKNFELIIVVNGVDANSIALQIFDWYGDDNRIRVYSTPIKDLSFSLSLGVHLARTPLIARMDSDDISAPNRLDIQRNFMVNNPHISVIGSAYEIIDSDGVVKSKKHMPTSNDTIRRALFFNNPFCHPSVMFRRSVVTDVGGYLGGLHAEDYDLWCRLSLDKNVVFANLPDACLGYRVVGVGNARGSRSAYASMLASQMRNFIVTFDVKWLIAALVSFIKVVFKSK